MRAAARDYKETAALSAAPKETVVYERSDGAGQFQDPTIIFHPKDDGIQGL
jgi:hypothetical protein